MAQPGKTFRIFVRSTSSDLKAGRNALQGRIFPRQGDLCQLHDSHFHAIDLRWDVSNEAAFDEQATNFYLGKI